MFDDARFYNRLAEDSASYGRVKCSNSAMFLSIGKLELDDDLLSAIDEGECWLIDDSEPLAA